MSDNGMHSNENGFTKPLGLVAPDQNYAALPWNTLARNTNYARIPASGIEPDDAPLVTLSDTCGLGIEAGATCPKERLTETG